METFEEHYASMKETILTRMPGVDMELIDKAVEYADAKHASQKRKDGSPYIIHPLAVAEIVVEMGLDMDAILGALHGCLFVHKDACNTLKTDRETNCRNAFADELANHVVVTAATCDGAAEV